MVLYSNIMMLILFLTTVFTSILVAELSTRQGLTEGTCWGFVAASQCGLQLTSALKTDYIGKIRCGMKKEEGINSVIYFCS